MTFFQQIEKFLEFGLTGDFEHDIILILSLTLVIVVGVLYICSGD